MQTDCKSTLCSCRRNGLSCATACVGCHGQSCSNADTTSMWLNATNSHDVADQDPWYDSDVDWICEEMVEDRGILMQQVHMPVEVVKATLLEVVSMAGDYSHSVTVQLLQLPICTRYDGLVKVVVPTSCYSCHPASGTAQLLQSCFISVSY